MLLDEVQLEEPDSSSAKYKAIGDVKSELQSASDILDFRLDLVEKADASKIGWSAAVQYEKVNGPVRKADSDKLWVEAEKSVELKRKEKPQQPFRSGPAAAGKDQYQSRSSKGNSDQTSSRPDTVFFVLLMPPDCF